MRTNNLVGALTVAAMLSGVAKAEEWLIAKAGATPILGFHEGNRFKTCRENVVSLVDFPNATFKSVPARSCPAHSFSGLSADEPTAAEKAALEKEARDKAAEKAYLDSLN